MLYEVITYNDAVKKGELMAQIDKTKYQSTVDKANAALASAKATLENAKAELFRTEATIRRDRTRITSYNVCYTKLLRTRRCCMSN